MSNIFSRRSLSALLVLSLLVSSLGIFPQTAKAASVYDNTVVSGGDFTVNHESLESTCSTELINWGSIITDSSKWYGWNSTNYEAYNASFNAALDSERGWAVVQEEGKAGATHGTSNVPLGEGDNALRITWNDNGNALFQDDTYGKYLAAQGHWYTVWIYYNNSSCDSLGVVASTEASTSAYYNLNGLAMDNVTNWEASTFIFKPVFINFNITYPDGYGGGIPPDSVGEGVDQQIVRPNFTYQLNDKQIKAHDYNENLPAYTPTEGYTFNGYTVEWSLFKCSSFEEVTNLCLTDGEAVLSDHQILPQDSDYSFTVEDYSDYTLEAQYLVQECFRYPDYPATPDYCYYSDLETHMPQYEFTTTEIHLLVNGQSLTGDTTGETCDESGFCQVDSTICYSEEDFITQLNCRFTKSFNTGLLNPSINAFKHLLTSLVVPTSPSCNIPLSDVEIIPGKVFPFSTYSASACFQAAKFRNAFPIAPLLINFFLAVTFLYLMVRIINRLMDNRETDIIEGIK